MIATRTLMATAPTVGGYRYREQIARIKAAGRHAAVDLGLLLDDVCGPAARATCLARITIRLTEIADAADQLDRIGRAAFNERTNRSVRSPLSDRKENL